MTGSIRWVARIACLALPLVFGASAEAANSAEELRRWLAQIAAQGASVHVDGVESSADGASARALGLVIETPPAAGRSDRTKITFGTLSVTRADETAGSFRLDSAHADDLRLSEGDAYLKASSVDVKDVDLPRTLETALDPRHPTASLIRFVRQLFSAHAGAVKLAGVSWTIPGASSEDVNSVALVSVDGVDADAIASIRLRNLATSRDKAQAVTRIAEVSLKQVSPAVLIGVLDPQTYRTPAADRPWRAVVEHASLAGLDARSGGAHTVLQQIDLGPIEVRRFSFDPTAILDLAAIDSPELKEQPALRAQLANGFADAVRVAKASLRSFITDDGADPPGRRTQADAIDLVELAPRTARSVKVSGLQIQAGEGGLRAGQIGVDDVELGASAQMSNSAGPIAIPKFANLTLTDMVFVRPGVNATLGSVRIEAGGYVGMTPTHVVAAIENLSVPVADLPASPLKANLTDLNLEKLELTAAVAADWQEVSEQFELSSAQVSAAGVGELSASAALVGVPRGVFEHPESLADILASAQIQQVRLNFRDAGLTGRVLDKFAAVNKVSVARVRSALTSNMPTIFGAVTDAASRNRLIFAAIAFLNDPKSVSVFTTIEAPQPLAKALDAFRNSPQSLPGLLKLDAVANRSSQG